MAITVDVADDGSVQVRTADIGTFVQHFGPRISPKGVLLETQDSFPRGRELELRMGLEEGLDLIEAVAMVAWRRRPAGDQPEAVGLHLLAVTSGAEFIQRLVAERLQDGRPVFDLELAAPVSEDGSPIEADQIDLMIARRGDRGVRADLGDDGAEAETEPGEEAQEAPDFAPGFGKSMTWNQQLQAAMPRSVSNWLGGPGTSEGSGDADAPERARGGAAPFPDVEPADDASSGARSLDETDRDGAQESPGAPRADQEPPPVGSDRPPWRSSNSEVKPPEGPPAPGPLHRPVAPRPPVEPEPTKRSGPIKMKLAADRQPSGGSASETLSGALESSFVEASRRAENLLREPPPKVYEPKSPASEEALSTVVLDPGEMKRMVDRVRAEQESRAEDEDSPAEHVATASGGASGSRASGSHAPGDRASGDHATADGASRPHSPSPPSKEPALEPEPSLLNMDRAVLEAAAKDEFGYPQEDRTPMIIVGGIVLLIVVGLVLWLILG